METEKAAEKIHETKSCFFENIHATDKPLANLTKKEKTQVTTLRNEMMISLQTLLTSENCAE